LKIRRKKEARLKGRVFLLQGLGSTNSPVSDYNAFRGGLKSALRRTFLTTEDTKGAQRGTKLKPARSPDMSEGRCGSLP